MAIRLQRLLTCPECLQKALVDYYPVKWSDPLPTFIIGPCGPEAHQLRIWQASGGCLGLGETTLEINGVKRRVLDPRYIPDGTYSIAVFEEDAEE